MPYFLYRLIPPRPTFASDMTEHEAAVMRDHVAYWRELVERGTAVVFGPVGEPAGVWGLGVVEAETEDGVRALGEADPAVARRVARFEVYPMLSAVVAGRRAAA